MHANAVMEQLEKVIEVIHENPEKVVGLKLTSMVDIPIDDLTQRKIVMEVQNTLNVDNKSMVKF